MFSHLELKKMPHRLRARDASGVERLSPSVIIEQTEGKQGEWHDTCRLNRGLTMIDLQ